MQITIFLDGQEYIAPLKEDQNLGEAASAFREFIHQAGSLKLPLEDNKFLVLGKEALNRAHFIFKP